MRRCIIVLALALALAACGRSSERITPSAREAIEGRFARAGVSFPPRRIHIRILKRERELELWASDEERGPMRLVQRYPVCGMSGGLGPKRRQGDRQVPEGFYVIDRFNPHSRHVVSLGLSYPNAADRVHSDRRRPGGDIFIHGGCSSAGCIAVGDRATQEIFLAAVAARDAGQRRIPVHVYPARLTRRGLREITRVRPRHRAFWASMRPAYEAFERTHEPPEVRVDARGRYVLARGRTD